MGLIKEVSEFIERVPRAAWSFSLPLIAIGGSVLLGTQAGIIRPDAWDGVISDVAGVGLAAGLGILCLGVIYSAAALPGRLIGYIRAHNEKRDRGDALTENLRFVPETAVLLLYSALQQSSGRIPAIRTRSFDRLWELELLAEDNPSPYQVLSGPPSSGMVRVAPEIYQRRAQILPDLKQRLALTYQGDLDDPKYVTRMLGNAVKAENSVL